jgi:hypothetical protein
MWLHLTMQGIGFTDEVSDRKINAITTRITERFAKLPRPLVTFARPAIRTEAIYLPASPANSFDELRSSAYGAIADVIGPERSPEPPWEMPQYRPHVNIAYVNSAGPAQPYIEALRKKTPEPVTVPIRSAAILTFHRDNRMYQWTTAVRLPIGPDDLADMAVP